MSQGHNNDDDERKDLTRIENLSEFLHEEDPDLESKFGSFNTDANESTSTDLTSGISIDELDAPPALPDIPEELPSEEISSGFESSFSDEVSETPFELSTEENEFNLPSDDEFQVSDEMAIDSPEEEFQLDSSEEISIFETPEEEVSETIFEEELPETQPLEEPVYHQKETPQFVERFEEVKTFAQNFSYGQIQGGGNPPFSIVVRNLKYQEEKEDIINLLTEFGLVNEKNLEETQKALEFGALLIPQISEYSAIIIAHKLRRFDCDMEMGLSDEVHPSKSNDQNPRGLIKKESLRQNKVESYTKSQEDTPVHEIIVSTTSTLEGYIIKKYLGVQTSFAIVDEDELERLKYVQENIRSNQPIQNYETEENITSERAFKNFQSSFEHLFVDLADQLKTKAMKEKANALLGLNYQLTALPLQKTSKDKNCYQLTCSATLAVVKPE